MYCHLLGLWNRFDRSDIKSSNFEDSGDLKFPALSIFRTLIVIMERLTSSPRLMIVSDLDDTMVNAINDFVLL